MNTKSPLSEFARRIGAALILGAMAANSHGGPTDLATEPFTSGGSLRALPNVMFVLDDSGSMRANYLPDWAGPVLASDNVTVLTPFHRFYNSAFNGVAYNPATYYRPPVMYTNTGALDTTTYPGMDGQSVARGGDGTATAGSPNWRAVKGDGYGIQNVAPAPATANLEGNAFSYTTVPGEYCTDEKLRTCVVSAAPTGIYTVPAKLRWCDTSANAQVSTTEAGTRCQAANIDNSATNIANGVTPYTFARMPAPRRATFTVTGAASVTGITVDALQILSAATVGGGANTATTVATDIALKINACTYGRTGACGVEGYSATSSGAVVTLTAPGTTSASPVITGGSTGSIFAFAAPTSPVTSTITVTGTGAITGITVSGVQILSAATSTGVAIAPVVTGSATISPAPTTFAGTPNISTLTVTAGGVVSSVMVNGKQILSAATVSHGTPRTVALRIRDQINACTAAITGSCTVGGYSATVPGSPSATITIIAPRPVVTGATTTTTTFSFGSPDVATITVTGYASSVTNVTVGGLRITSAGTGTAGITSNTLMATAITNRINACTAGLSGSCTVAGYSATSSGAVVSINAPSNTTAVATQIAANINACTAGIVGACGVAGYKASSNGAVVTLIAPSATVVTPAISGGSATATPFGFGSVPGSSLFTVITPSVTSYPFPGTATKAVGRTDCAGTTCTYAEEMTNYANWYAYYRTRMQMMKTASSIAFSSVDDQFRVGYYSINNGSGSEFLNPSAFDGAQKNAWYTKFLNATPFGATPLRTALANTGRLYAGQLATLNGVLANDPMQYSCQQNFTILSTDGYWNDSTTPTQIDGTTEIGNQDHNDPRPYYDGGTQTLTTSTTWGNDEQFAANTALFEERTRQQQVATRRLTQSAITTTTYPFQLQTTQLRTRSTPLNQNTFRLESRTYPLVDTSRQLQKNTFLLQSTTRPLESYTFQLTKVTTPLDRNTYNVTRNTRLVDRNVFNVTRTISPLQKSTFTLQRTTQQLQVKDNVSTDGGDTWNDTAWTDTSSCTVTPGNVSTFVRNRRCQYAAPVVTTGLSSCTAVAASPGPTDYTVGLASACVYEAAVVTAVGTCTTGSASGSSPYASYTTCAYGTAAAPVSNLTSCAANNQSGPSYTGDRVVCAYDATPTNTSNLATCTWVVPSPAASSPKTECSYEAVVPTTNQTTCTAAAAATATTNGSVWNTTTACAYDATPTNTSNLATCTWVVPATSAASPKTECSYEAVVPTTNQTTCTAAAAASATTNGSVWNTTTACAYDATPTNTSDLAACTWVVPATSAASPKTECSYEAVVPTTNQTTCTAVAAATATTNGSVWNTTTACAYDATPASTATNQASCTWVVPSPAASAPRTDCSYNAGAATTATNQATCTPVAQSTGTTNGTVWAGPAVACNWQAAVVATNLATCTPTGSAAGPPFNQYTTCGYGTGTVLTGLNSCAKDDPEPGPSYTGGQTVACAYQGTATTTNVDSPATCVTVAQDTTNFSAPQVTCSYAAPVVTSGVANCTNATMSASSPYTVNVAHSCAYSGTASATDLNATTCTANRDSAPTFDGPAVDCTYSGTATTTTNVPSCTWKDAQTGPAYTGGGRVTCSYGTASGWSNVSSGTCTYNNPTATPGTTGTVYAPGVECAYNATPVDTLVDSTCAADPGQSGTANGTVYSTLQRKVCTPGAFPSVAAPVVTTPVDTCDTTPTSTPAVLGVFTNTATTCTYLAPVTVNAGTTGGGALPCVPVAASTGPAYVTSVSCPVTDTGYFAVTPGTCTPQGTPEPAPLVFDPTTGKIVQCRETDTTVYNATFPAAPPPRSQEPGCRPHLSVDRQPDGHRRCNDQGADNLRQTGRHQHRTDPGRSGHLHPDRHPRGASLHLFPLQPGNVHGHGSRLHPRVADIAALGNQDLRRRRNGNAQHAGRRRRLLLQDGLAHPRSEQLLRGDHSRDRACRRPLFGDQPDEQCADHARRPALHATHDDIHARSGRLGLHAVFEHLCDGYRRRFLDRERRRAFPARQRHRGESGCRRLRMAVGQSVQLAGARQRRTDHHRRPLARGDQRARRLFQRDRPHLAVEQHLLGPGGSRRDRRLRRVPHGQQCQHQAGRQLLFQQHLYDPGLDRRTGAQADQPADRRSFHRHRLVGAGQAGCQALVKPRHLDLRQQRSHHQAEGVQQYQFRRQQLLPVAAYFHRAGRSDAVPVRFGEHLPVGARSDQCGRRQPGQLPRRRSQQRRHRDQQQQVLPAARARAGRPGQCPGGVCEQAAVQLRRSRLHLLHRRPGESGCDALRRRQRRYVACLPRQGQRRNGSPGRGGGNGGQCRGPGSVECGAGHGCGRGRSRVGGGRGGGHSHRPGNLGVYPDDGVPAPLQARRQEIQGQASLLCGWQPRQRRYLCQRLHRARRRLEDDSGRRPGTRRTRLLRAGHYRSREPESALGIHRRQSRIFLRQPAGRQIDRRYLGGARPLRL